MAKKKYWQSFTDLKSNKLHLELEENEFAEELPFETADSKGLTNSPASRRDFLKYLGFSTAAAIAAASCETPVRKAIPYLNKPQNLVPGVADFYASTYVSGGEAVPIVVKVRDGRPIKIEGNTLSNFTRGATTSRVQASVLDLYDTSRLRYPIANGNASSYENIDRALTQALASGPVVLLTSTVTSPTTKQIIQEFLAKYPGSRHVQFDAVSYSALLLANEATYGRRSIPSYRFDAAKTIVSIGADFLGTWLSPIEFTKQYANGRRFSDKNQSLSKHFQFESMLSMTGANADERYTHRPSETGIVAAALLSAVNGQGATGVTGKLKTGIEKAAKDLIANRGTGLVVCGSNNVQIQTIVSAINEAIGANGSTINWTAPLQTHQGLDSEMAGLLADMEGRRIGALLIYDVNPAYEYFDGERFKNALKGLKVSVSLNGRMDETTELCKYVAPSSHFLESWGDAEPKLGYFSMMQPTIAPLFKTRQFQDTLLKWSGNALTYDAYFKNYWVGKLAGVDNYNKALQDGVVEPSIANRATVSDTSTRDTTARAVTFSGSGVFNGSGVSAATSAVNGFKKNGKAELVIYQKVSMGSGHQGNNPWLLELPDPITRATWDNYAIISVPIAKELGIDLDDDYEVHPEKPVITFKAGNKTIELPVLVIPGMQANTIAIAVGYGRNSSNAEKSKDYLGRAIAGIGKNAYPLLSYNGSTIEWTLSDISYTKSGKDPYKIAQVQTHNSYEGRHEVVKEVTIVDFVKNPQMVREERNEELQNYGGLERFEKDATLYPYHDKPGIKWGMSIDLNTCIGCHACVVACHAENNVPVVGKKEVLRFHDMHWMRIDRYFTGDYNDPESIQTVFQPMLCQHCDNAPCENVCPVAATPHSAEGINMMTYNRCIGTRYCANNCPYKVRRFNWLDYTGSDSFTNDQKTMNEEGVLDDTVLMMNDDLTRMVLNPDVTVRSRGVMEKCSFCVQRLQDAKLKAKKENRPLVTGSENQNGETLTDVQTACQQACPTDAIVFGNSNDSKSGVTQTRHDNALRLFYSLEQIHTLPNVSYLTKVRNTDVLSAHATHGDLHDEQKEGKKPEAHG
ncbi:MAG: TAT-variant-translocated molybdopterin oxidoreductase [Chitinophagaceae bacterium]|nr:TAT-variant-translocated molybdopterin oxidoreductase [Chitinophagaceae bacterium]